MEFTQKFTVNAPLAAVAAVHNDTRALRWLSPPPIIVQFHDVQPLGEGSTAEFTLWMGPFPVRWLAYHYNYDRLTGFVDEQRKGPFKRWIHTHRFTAIDDNTTEVSDHIVAEYRPHPLWGPIGLFMWLGLPFMFFYRKVQTQRHAKEMTYELAQNPS